MRKVCVSQTEIASTSRTRDLTHVRALISLLARDIKGLSILEVANRLKRDPGGLRRLASRLEEKSANSPLLKQGIISLKNELLEAVLPGSFEKSLSHV